MLASFGGDVWGSLLALGFALAATGLAGGVLYVMRRRPPYAAALGALLLATVLLTGFVVAAVEVPTATTAARTTVHHPTPAAPTSTTSTSAPASGAGTVPPAPEAPALPATPLTSGSVSPPGIDGYLPNPGIGYQGWTHAHGDLAQSTEYRRGEHPEQGGFDWATLNPAVDVFDWSPIDDFLQQCEARGEQGSFRIMTMTGAPYGTHRVPAWVVDDGAVITDSPDREPDYRSRTYQEHWGAFVDALARRYDGDPRIAFIDISGYGRFNEWQATATTDHGDVAGEADSIDSATRRHLVHMFVGGSGTARTLSDDGRTESALDYDHAGFQRTQLLMPYGGIWASTRYVAAHHPDVGFRNDALFSPHADLATLQQIGYGVTDIWRRAPVVFETVDGADPSRQAAAAETLRGMGASLLHDNTVLDEATLAELVPPLGYRYALDRVTTGPGPTGSLSVSTEWTNTGSAPSYPRMGQDLAVGIALADRRGRVVASWVQEAQVATWLPGESRVVAVDVPLPALPAGEYTVLIGMVERTTESRIELPVAGGRPDNWYPIGPISLS
ncbi:Beta-galactosidase [Trujillonella endophytica]|uniref:Beta-galactosidase n=1 Tax=Trujillonella endophytica TaxID=673521 RepID=A0A1H8W5E7_9ACTN|nr:Beta-galactosidase [Trujillella endophytica]